MKKKMILPVLILLLLLAAALTFCTLRLLAHEQAQNEELDRIETDTGRYVALLPLPETPDQITEEDSELIILKVQEEKGDTYLCPIEDDEEFEEIGAAFEERLAELFDIEEDEE